MKDESDRQIMKKLVELKAKTWSYLKNNNDEDKKSKRHKICLMERKLKFEDYKNYLKAVQIEN